MSGVTFRWRTIKRSIFLVTSGKALVTKCLIKYTNFELEPSNFNSGAKSYLCKFVEILLSTSVCISFSSQEWLLLYGTVLLTSRIAVVNNSDMCVICELVWDWICFNIISNIAKMSDWVTVFLGALVLCSTSSAVGWTLDKFDEEAWVLSLFVSLITTLSWSICKFDEESCVVSLSVSLITSLLLTSCKFDVEPWPVSLLISLSSFKQSNPNTKSSILPGSEVSVLHFGDINKVWSSRSKDGSSFISSTFELQCSRSSL